jgi:hypothetical protein
MTETFPPSVTVDDVYELNEPTEDVRAALRAARDGITAAIAGLNQIDAMLVRFGPAKRDDLADTIKAYQKIGAAVTRMANNVNQAIEAGNLATADLGVVCGFADGTFEHSRRRRGEWIYKLSPRAKAVARQLHRPRVVSARLEDESAGETEAPAPTEGESLAEKLANLRAKFTPRKG